jgi:predicted transcriptional regulator
MERAIISPLKQFNNVKMRKKLNIEELDVENHIAINRFDANSVYRLSQEEEEGIKESLAQVAEGKLISNEDLLLEVSSWFKEL